MVSCGFRNETLSMDEKGSLWVKEERKGFSLYVGRPQVVEYPQGPLPRGF